MKSPLPDHLLSAVSAHSSDCGGLTESSRPRSSGTVTTPSVGSAWRAREYAPSVSSCESTLSATTTAPGSSLSRAAGRAARSRSFSASRKTTSKTSSIAGSVSNASPSTSSAHSLEAGLRDVRAPGLDLAPGRARARARGRRGSARPRRARSSSSRASRRSRAPRSRSAARRTRRGTGRSSARPGARAARAATPRSRSSASSASRRASTARTRRRASARASRPAAAARHGQVGEVVVDDAAGLHRRVDGRRADEAEARLAQLLRERLRLRASSRASRRRARRGARSSRYDQTSSCSGVPGFAQRDCRRARWRSRPRSCRGGGRCRRRASSRSTSRSPKRGDALGVEAGERRAEVLALAQDRQPREPGLEALEAEPLEQPALVDAPAGPIPRRGSALYSASSALSQQRVGSGELDLDHPVLDPDGKRLDRLDRRQRQRRGPCGCRCCAPWRGQIATPVVGSRSRPRRAGPSSCEQRSSSAQYSPSRL